MAFANGFSNGFGDSTAEQKKPLLQVSSLSKSFGGVEALVDISFEIKPGSVTSVIGPNGAGKTTLFNCISGLLKPDRGQAVFKDTDITGWSPDRITSLGLGRTFQNIRLFQSMNVLENVIVGFYSETKSNIFDAFAITSRDRRERKHVRDRGMELLQWVGVEHMAQRWPGELPYGDRRRLEIARALAMDPVMVLLDEPAAGMIRAETDDLSSLIEKIKTLGITVLLIEHNMAFVMAISDWIVVLNFGRKIAEGTSNTVRSDTAVIEAYLGSEAGS